MAYTWLSYAAAASPLRGAGNSVLSCQRGVPEGAVRVEAGAWRFRLIKNAPDYEGTKALASRNKELNTQVTKDIEARKVEMKVIELHQQMVNTMESAASTGKLPTENTSISERISRLSKMRSDYYNVIRNGIGAEFYRIERENLPVKPEVIRGLEKLVAQADEMKAIAKRNLAEVEAVLKKLQGYL